MNQEQNNTPASEESILEAATQFIMDSEEYEVTQLIRNGTLWVDLDSVRLDNVTVEDILRLGPRMDGITREHSSGFGLVADMDGLADGYMMESEVIRTDDKEEEDPTEGYTVLKVEEAKGILITCLTDDLEGGYSEIIEKL